MEVDMLGGGSGAGTGAGAGSSPVRPPPVPAKKRGDGHKRLMPWVEKYRPKKMKDIAFQDEVVHTLENSIRTGTFPHLLFYGPPGTGKTSTITAVCRELFGTEMLKSRVKELNASDERGINVIRTTVKQFAQTAVGSGSHSGRFPCPPFKIIILDEADSLTKDAQTALRRTMEAHTKVTRFCLICNYVSRIIDPIASRCAKFRFMPLKSEAMVDRLKYIAEQEGLTIDDAGYAALVKVSGGDLRKAITTMQSTASFCGSEVTAEDVIDMSGALPDDVCDALWEAIKTGPFDKVKAAVDDLVAGGYAMSQIIEQMTTGILGGDFTDGQKGRMFEALAKADKCLADGADEALQLQSLASALCRAATNKLVSCDAPSWDL